MLKPCQIFRGTIYSRFLKPHPYLKYNDLDQTRSGYTLLRSTETEVPYILFRVIIKSVV